MWTYATWSNTTNQTGFLPTGKTAPGSTTIPHPDLLNGPNNIVPTEFSYIGFDNIYNELDNAYFLRDIGPDIEVPAPTQCRVVLNINSLRHRVAKIKNSKFEAKTYFLSRCIILNLNFLKT